MDACPDEGFHRDGSNLTPALNSRKIPQLWTDTNYFRKIQYFKIGTDARIFFNVFSFYPAVEQRKEGAEQRIPVGIKPINYQEFILILNKRDETEVPRFRRRETELTREKPF